MSEYRIEEGRVVYEHHYVGVRPVEGADPATFDVLHDPSLRPHAPMAARDRRGVWFMHVPVPDADPATFEFFHGGQCRWGRDAARIYCFYVDARPRVKVVNGDPASFGFLPEPDSSYLRQYAYDRRFVYYYGRRVRGVVPQRFRAIAAETVRLDTGDIAIDTGWADYHRDDSAIVYAGRRLPGADPDTFRVVTLTEPGQPTWHYGLDVGEIYYRGRGLTETGDPHLPYARATLARYLTMRADLAPLYGTLTIGSDTR